VGSFISGAAWGASAILLFPEQSVLHQAFLLLLVAGISAGNRGCVRTGKGRRASLRPAALLPLAGRFFYHGGSVHITMGFMVIAFTIVLVVTSYRIYATNTESLTMRFERQELIRFLSAEKAKTENLNRELQTEIADRKRAEEALRRSDETARALLNANMDAAVLLDTSGKLLAFNEVFSRNVGHDASDLEGSSIFDLFPSHLALGRKSRADEVFRTRKAGPFRRY
jgi:PAS domain-containing protein